MEDDTPIGRLDRRTASAFTDDIRAHLDLAEAHIRAATRRSILSGYSVDLATSLQREAFAAIGRWRRALEN